MATEAVRLATLKKLEILDTDPQVEYDNLAKLASVICGTPISFFMLVDKDRQWAKAACGANITQTPISQSFCAHAIEQEEIFIVEDASQHPTFKDNPLVTGSFHLRFYAGMPIKAPDGVPIGTLCVIDSVPRRLTEKQVESLKILAAQIEQILQLRAAERILLQLLQEKNQLLLDAMRNSQLLPQPRYPKIDSAQLL